MAEQPVYLYEKKLNGRVVVMTMNRPEAMNALNSELTEAIYDGWVRFRDDDEAWVAIITGAGDRSFTTGADLKEINKTGKTEAQKRSLKAGGPLCETLNLWKPTIAAINGYAVAGGWMIAQQCDIRIAAEHAEMGITETRWNVPASWITPITRQLQLAHALEIALWGNRRITAQRAYEMGWVNKVVTKEKLMEEAMTWAEQMLYLAPREVRNLKEILYRSYHMSPLDSFAFASGLEQNLTGMEDSIEGPKAFVEKRKPTFKNK